MGHFPHRVASAQAHPHFLSSVVQPLCTTINQYNRISTALAFPRLETVALWAAASSRIVGKQFFTLAEIYGRFPRRQALRLSPDAGRPASCRWDMAALSSYGRSAIFGTCWGLLDGVISWDIPGSFGTYWDLSGHAGTCRDLLGPAGTWFAAGTPGAVIGSGRGGSSRTSWR